MHLSELKPKHEQKDAKRVGRGGKRGKTSGRGTKGQKARAGRKMRPELRDVIKRMPKLRGHGKNRGKTVVPQLPVLVVNLATLEKVFSAGETVSPETLAEKKVLRLRQSMKYDVKVLGAGDLSKKLSVVGCLVSAAARVKIEAAGGSVA